MEALTQLQYKKQWNVSNFKEKIKKLQIFHEKVLTGIQIMQNNIEIH